MKTNYPEIFTWFLFTSVLGCLGCECLGGPRHSFEEKVLFTPEHLQYHVGDTIWMTSEFSCRGLLNLETGQTEDYCGIDKISFSSQLFLLEPWPQDTQAPTPGVKDFDFLNVHGVALPANDRNIDVFFQRDQDEYSLKIGIIPKRVGKYMLSVTGGGSYQLPGSKKCDTGSFGFSPENMNRHISLLEAFKKGAENVTDLERSQLYCFEVIQ